MAPAKLASLLTSLVFASAILYGCAGQTVNPAHSSAVSSTSLPAGSSSNSPGPSVSSPASADDWPTYHRDLSRGGFDPNFNLSAQPRRLWTSETLDGDIYAEPLIVGQKVFAATEQDSVYCLDLGTGQTTWRVNLGSPVPGGELSCGNIDPSGITSTPVADPAAGRLYVVGRFQPNHHELFVLDLQTGQIISHRPVDPPGSDSKVQQQRGALALSNDKIYIPFGGLFGDCGAYNGWVVAAPADGTGQNISYKVLSQRGAGIWAPSGPAIDSSGDVYVTTGNGFSSTTFDYGNSVIRLSPDLALKDYFTPGNWQALNQGDVDLGSMGPLLLPGGKVFQAGKEGKGYLLNAGNLGHTGGEVFAGSFGAGAFGGAAYAPPFVLVPTTNGLVALRMENSSFKTAWSSQSFFAGPPVVAGNTVLTVDTGSGSLAGFALDTGTSLFKISVGTGVHFNTPALSGGRVFVAAERRILSFGP